jgi:2-methylisocitrate lyase-like PEP mutase family enzyme
MMAVCREVPGHHLANMVEGGDTPVLPPTRLAELGFKIAAYPLSLLSVATRAMNEALAALAAGRSPEGLLPFSELREIVGFDAYDASLSRLTGERGRH